MDLAWQYDLDSGDGSDAFEMADGQNPEVLLRCVYEQLLIFREKYAGLFADKNAEASYASAFPQRHMQLRRQIAEPLAEICKRQVKTDPVFLAEFIADSMLTWTLEGRSFEEIGSILLQLF